MAHTNESATSLTLLQLLCQPANNDDAWRAFFQRYQPLIYRWCTHFNLQAADVEDVSQKVLQNIFSKIGSYDPERGKRFRGWLKTVVQNAVKDQLRSTRRRAGDRGSGDSKVIDLLKNLQQPSPNVDPLVNQLDTMLQRDLRDIRARVAAEVAPDTMRCFDMVILQGRPIADVAAELNKSYAAVCMAVKRVKEKLRAEGCRHGAGNAGEN